MSSASVLALCATLSRKERKGRRMLCSRSDLSYSNIRDGAQLRVSTSLDFDSHGKMKILATGGLLAAIALGESGTLQGEVVLLRNRYFGRSNGRGRVAWLGWHMGIRQSTHRGSFLDPTGSERERYVPQCQHQS